MTDYNQIFSNLRSKISSMNDQNYNSLRDELKTYFSNINSDFNFKGPNEAKKEYNDWLESMDSDHSRKMHIFYWNSVEKIKTLGLYYLNFKKMKNTNSYIKNWANSKVEELKKTNKKNEKEESVNNRLAEYYQLDIEDGRYYTTIFKYITHFLLTIMVIIFLVKKQYSNLKILFYIFLSFLISYTIEPIWSWSLDYTHGYNRVYHLYLSYYYIFLVFCLFNSFKYFVFNDDYSGEGKRDLKILMGLMIFGLGCLLFNYLYYGIGMKSLRV
jgi:hypothetical protein